MKLKCAVAMAVFFAIGTVPEVLGCTSAVVGAAASANGRPMLWKHRDTGTEHNFVERVAPDGDSHGYVALFNGGDSLLTEAWAGVNDAGFGIINTASYNLAPDTATIKDREGIVMSHALARCTSLADFCTLLDTLPRPMGIQANFGVIDAHGHAAYLEACDTGYVAFDAHSAPDDVLIRTNYSMSGADGAGSGYIRYDNAVDLLSPAIKSHTLTPSDFIDGASRSFWHSLQKHDYLADTLRWVVDQDFIPRRISSASIVIIGVNPGQDPAEAVMLTALGYPPVAECHESSVEYVPDELRPLQPGCRSRACNEALERKRRAFPIKQGSGQHYIDMDYIRSLHN